MQPNVLISYVQCLENDGDHYKSIPEQRAAGLPFKKMHNRKRNIEDEIVTSHDDGFERIPENTRGSVDVKFNNK